LERRQLLAADLEGFRHNLVDAEDVNNDGQVTVVDAQAVLNDLKSQSPSFEPQLFTDVNRDGRRTALDALRVINRLDGNSNLGDFEVVDLALRQKAPTTLLGLPADVRSFDGMGNNLEHTERGSVGQPLLRVADAAYADGIASPAGSTRPSPRVISNTLSNLEGEGSRSDRGLSAFLYAWGQFIDHDMDLTEPAADGERFDVMVPAGDPFFDPDGTGEVTIPLTRSNYDPQTGTSAANPRQQINQITAFLDGSQVYGSNRETADALRTFDGGRLMIRDNGLLPVDAAGMVIAGDVRASENIGLTAMHTLFVREHNRLADQFAQENSLLSDEEIYQQARAIVIAEIQAITYNEFLPALLGRKRLSKYKGYDSDVDPGIANEFSTAVFRFGHSTLNDDIQFVGGDGRPVRDAVSLKDAFFNPSLLEATGIDSILKFHASAQAQEIDLQVVDSLRNFLFGPPGAGGLDLVSLNIQRGRDHGLADYNATRVAYGLDTVDSFEDITSNLAIQQRLAELYGDVDRLDLWVGLLAEEHLTGASVGELALTIITDQFQRLRDGDRFYYENIFAKQELRTLQQTTLADIIKRNTNVQGLQENVFFMLAEARGQVTVAMAATALRGFSDAGARARKDWVEGLTIELLDDDGNVIDTTTTDRRGEYRFQSFAETGDYAIRLAETGETLEILISNGNTRLSGLDFVIQI
jgi:hypothetical protein